MKQNSWDFDTTYNVGDLLYASDSDTLTKLPIGAEGDVLSVSSGVPAWMPPTMLGNWILIDSASGTNVSSLELDIPAEYTMCALVLNDVIGTTTNQNMFMRVSNDGGSSFFNTGYVSNNTTGYLIGNTGSVVNNAVFYLDGIIFMVNCNTANNFFCYGDCMKSFSEAASANWYPVSGTISQTGINALQVIMASGNTTGELFLYGIRAL